MLTLPFATTLAAAVLSTSFLSGIFGTAGGMLLMGILLVFMPFAAAMVLHGVTQMASNVCRAWLWRAHIEWRITGYFAIGSVGAALGFAAIGAIPAKPVALIILGLLPFVGLLMPHRSSPDIAHRGHALGCGVICTSLQLMAGVSGPVLDVYFIRSNLDRKQMVATKATIQALGHCLKVVYFGGLMASGADAVSPVVIALAVVLALVGTQLSRHVLDAISDAQFRSWTRRLVTAIAAFYLIQGLVLVADGYRSAAAVAAPPTSVSSVAQERTP
jgi:uncharacterized membrane protein YfcA